MRLDIFSHHSFAYKRQIFVSRKHIQSYRSGTARGKGDDDRIVIFMRISPYWISADKWDCNANKCVRFRDVGFRNDRFAQANITTDLSFRVNESWGPHARGVLELQSFEATRTNAELSWRASCGAGPKTTSDKSRHSPNFGCHRRNRIISQILPFGHCSSHAGMETTLARKQHIPDVKALEKTREKMMEQDGFRMRILLRSPEGLFIA